MSSHESQKLALGGRVIILALVANGVAHHVLPRVKGSEGNIKAIMRSWGREWKKMFGYGKRNRELKVKAQDATTKLIEEAIFEDKRRRGDADKTPLSADERGSTIAAWFATARLTWQRAKRGDADALRQTARNYLFGSGMPVNPRKARLWLEVARLLEVEHGMEDPRLDPFWERMANELDKMLTAKEHRKALQDALDWVLVHRQIHGC